MSQTAVGSAPVPSHSSKAKSPTLAHTITSVAVLVLNQGPWSLPSPGWLHFSHCSPINSCPCSYLWPLACATSFFIPLIRPFCFRLILIRSGWSLRGCSRDATPLVPWMTGRKGFLLLGKLLRFLFAEPKCCSKSFWNVTHFNSWRRWFDIHGPGGR